MLFYRKFNNLYFLYELFFCISFSCRDIGKKLKKCTFFPRFPSATDSDADFQYVQWEAVGIQHEYQNSDLYRLMFLFVENWSNLTGLLTHIFPTPKCIFHFCCLLNFRFDRQIGSASEGGVLTPNPLPLVYTPLRNYTR